MYEFTSYRKTQQERGLTKVTTNGFDRNYSTGRQPDRRKPRGDQEQRGSRDRQDERKRVETVP